MNLQELGMGDKRLRTRVRGSSLISSGLKMSGVSGTRGGDGLVSGQQGLFRSQLGTPGTLGASGKIVENSEETIEGGPTAQALSLM